MSIAKMTKEDRTKFKELARAKFEERLKQFKASTSNYYKILLNNLPQRYKKTWLDCYEGKASKRKAIAAKCYECVGYEDTQNNVGKCTARGCPLWNYRPLQK